MPIFINTLIRKKYPFDLTLQPKSAVDTFLSRQKADQKQIETRNKYFKWIKSGQIKSSILGINLLKLSCLNFLPLEVVSRYRDTQLQVGENSSCYLHNVRPSIWTF